MQSNLEVWRRACALVKEHGDEAGLYAGLRAQALLKQSDVDGHLLWKRIAIAVKELQRERPAQGEWLN